MSEPAAQRATLQDVARRAGTSPAAASLALRGRPGVSESTRRRIVEAATDLVDARYGALGVLAPEGGLAAFIHVGIDDEDR